MFPELGGEGGGRSLKLKLMEGGGGQKKFSGGWGQNLFQGGTSLNKNLDVQGINNLCMHWVAVVNNNGSF